MSIYTAIRNRLRPIRLALKNQIQNTSFKIQRAINPPKLPINQDGKMLIHLGCGLQNDTRYINVDGVAFPHVHYAGEVEKLPMFKNNFADLIYACHVLEHISHQEMIKVLTEWQRVLKRGGVLRLSVPDFEKIIAIYEAENESITKIIQPLMGTQEGKYDFHKTIFNEKYLSNLLIEAGFSKVRLWNPEDAEYYDFNDWASTKLVHDKYPISLNLEAIK